MKQIHTQNAPQAIGAYSQAIVVENTIYLSGQIGLDPTTMNLVSDNFEKQLIQVFQNMGAVLKAAGSDFSKVAKLTVYLVEDFVHFPKLNDLMQQFFNTPFPARTTIAVKALPKNALIEIDAIACK